MVVIVLKVGSVIGIGIDENRAFLHSYIFTIYFNYLQVAVLNLDTLNGMFIF